MEKTIIIIEAIFMITLNTIFSVLFMYLATETAEHTPDVYAVYCFAIFVWSCGMYAICSIATDKLNQIKRGYYRW